MDLYVEKKKKNDAKIENVVNIAQCHVHMQILAVVPLLPAVLNCATASQTWHQTSAKKKFSKNHHHDQSWNTFAQ